MNVQKILRRNGRAFINDRLGYGKKLTAIAAAIIYRPEWPLLIVCPNVLVRTWIQELLKWIPKLNY
jgi:SWI/SNF-related matrix-associated actin-dependent regulator 1 of chromatin subfamily A